MKREFREWLREEKKAGNKFLNAQCATTFCYCSFYFPSISHEPPSEKRSAGSRRTNTREPGWRMQEQSDCVEQGRMLGSFPRLSRRAREYADRQHFSLLFSPWINWNLIGNGTCFSAFIFSRSRRGQLCPIPFPPEGRFNESISAVSYDLWRLLQNAKDSKGCTANDKLMAF